MKKNILLAAGLFILSCNNTEDNKNAKISTEIAEEQSSVEGVYFSCKVNGLPLTDNTDGGILDPITNMLLNVGENESYSVGIRIPTGLKAGETCTCCKGFVHAKSKQEGGILLLKNFEFIQNISITLSSRRKGYVAGTFSFSVKMKEDGDKIITVTDGKFAMNIDNE